MRLRSQPAVLGILFALGLALTLATAGPASAQDPATVAKYCRLLGGGAECGASLRDQTPAEPAARPTPRPAGGSTSPTPRPTPRPTPTPVQLTGDCPRIDLSVTFASGSTTLNRDSQDTLAALREALKLEQLQRFRFEIAGHTDAVGADDMNQRLSERRAASVRAFLLADGGVSQRQLSSCGYGERFLRQPNNPRARANRRVEIINLSCQEPPYPGC